MSDIEHNSADSRKSGGGRAMYSVVAINVLRGGSRPRIILGCCGYGYGLLLMAVAVAGI